MNVHFIDVGQGDAIWITTADDGIDGNGIFEGKNIIIDGGRYSSNTDNPLLRYLEQPAHHLAIVDALIVPINPVSVTAVQLPTASTAVVT